MPAKPATLPRFADLSAHVVEPGAAKKDVGFAPGERPPAQYLNWLLTTGYQWLLHVNNLLTTGGGVTDNVDTSGNANFGGTLGVGGIATFTGLINANNGIAVPTTKHVTLAGTSEVKHGDRILQMSAGFFQSPNHDTITTPRIDSSAGAPTAWRNFGAASPNQIIIGAIPLRVGDRIKSLKWYYDKASNGANMNLRLERYTMLGGALGAVIDAVSDVTAGAAAVSLTRTLGAPYTIVAGETPFLQVSSSIATHAFFGCEITYDRP